MNTYEVDILVTDTEDTNTFIVSVDEPKELFKGTLTHLAAVLWPNNTLQVTKIARNGVVVYDELAK